jgi:uncharacterized integral membrane protein (TIGR00698 family)
MIAYRLLPGMGLALLLAMLSLAFAEWLSRVMPGTAYIPISPIMIAILLGILIANSMRISPAYEPGLRFSVSRILQLGIVFLGIRLSLTEFASIGISGLPIIAACIVSAILLVTYCSKRMGLSPQLGSLIAVGTSICGATAIIATAPTIAAKDHEVSYAVACITLFGLVAMLAYPIAAHWLFDGNVRQTGLFLGTAVHDTAQVAGAGMVYASLYSDDQVLNVATVTKLVRNLSMLIVIPVLSIAYHRKQGTAGQRAHWTSLVPLFIVGFAVMCVIRTVGDMSTTPFGLLTTVQWSGLVELIKTAAEVCLLAAMAAVGLSTSLAGIKSIGYKPLVMGLGAAAVVGLISITLISILYQPDY